MKQPDRLLALLEQEGDRRLLQHISVEAGWPLILANSIDDACRRLDADPIPVVFVDGDMEWRTALDRFRVKQPPPSVVLASRVVDHYVFGEVVRHGGFDVISRPLEGGEVRRITRLALQDWKSRWLTNQPLADRIKNQLG